MNKSSRAIPTGAALLACALAASIVACEDAAPKVTSKSAAQPSDDTTGTTASSTELPHAGKVVASIGIPEGPGALAVGEGAVWSISDSVSRLTRIDPRRNAVAARIKLENRNPCPPFPQSCGEAAAGNGAVWVSRPSDDTVLRIDPRTNSVTSTIRVGPQPDGVAVSPGAVWVVNAGGPSVSRIDPSTNRRVATIRVGSHDACCAEHMSIAAGGGAIWVAVPKMSALVRVDPATDSVTKRISLEEQPCGYLAAAGRAVWAAGAHCAAGVTRVDADTNRPTATVTGMQSPIGLTLASGDLWVADLDSKAINRVDPRTARVVSRLEVGGFPIRVAAGRGSVWVRDDMGRVLRVGLGGRPVRGQADSDE